MGRLLQLLSRDLTVGLLQCYAVNGRLPELAHLTLHLALVCADSNSQPVSVRNRKVVYKSRGLCAMFNYFGCGLYWSAALIWGWPTFNLLGLQKLWKRFGTCRSSVNVTKLFQNVCEDFSMWKTVRFSSSHAVKDIGPSCSSRGFYSSEAYMHLEFGESAASNQLECVIYTRLYGISRVLRPCWWLWYFELLCIFSLVKVVLFDFIRLLAWVQYQQLPYRSYMESRIC